MKKFLIEVTQADIDKGVRGSCGKCPVALALNRATGRESSVDADSLGFEGGECKFDACRAPVEVTAFVRAFDNTAPVKPFSFEIQIDA